MRLTAGGLGGELTVRSLLAEKRSVRVASQSISDEIVMTDARGHEEVNLTDFDGGSLSLEHDGGQIFLLSGDVPRFAVYNKKGPRFDLLSDEEGVTLELEHKKGGRRIKLWTDKNSEGLGLVDQKSTRAMLFSSTDDTSLELYDEKDRNRLSIGNEDLKNTVTGSIEHRPESSIVLFREDGKVLWSTP